MPGSTPATTSGLRQPWPAAAAHVSAEAIIRGAVSECTVCLTGKLTAAERQAVSYASPHALEARLRAKLADWRGLLRRNVMEGRGVLRQLLIGPLRFTPVNEERRRGYVFEGLIALDRLIAGVLELPTKVASPEGTALNCKGFEIEREGFVRAA